MNTRKSACGILLLLLLSAPVVAARAEVTGIAGRVEAVIEETRFGIDGDRDEVFEIFPGTSAILPLRVVASLTASGNEIAAGRAAAQFADPATSNLPNPAEFAINLALNSLTPNTRYDARVRTEEVRDIIFRPGELGAAVEGESVLTVGRLFIDGALAIFSVFPDRDLLGARVSLTVRVVQETDAGSLTVFVGSIEINGGVNGSATVDAAGQIDTNTLILSDLAPVSDEFDAFHVLIIPDLDIAYSYDASIGVPFKLRATVEIVANNLEGAVGVAAVVGAPTDSLQQVIGTTTGNAAAGKMLTAIQQEREHPTGSAAFPPPPPIAAPPLCGLFGIEALAGLALVVRLRSSGLPIGS